MSIKDQALSYLMQGYDFAMQWVTSAAAWSQFALKKNNIEIPYPRRVIEIKSTLPTND
ncbi:MAG: hypothetical protein JKX71_11210 [Amylibacter sp.]|nr:hypothetical protein [Amylibacter sp.]